MVLPLSGVKVVELTRDIAGPFCGMALADIGAEVFKVENPQTDSYRDGGSLWKGAKFVAYNRNKKSIAVDLSSDEGKLILSRLLETVDVFLENLPPSIVDKMGFSYPRVFKINPKIIYCSIKSYLQGPYGERDVEDTLLESQAGYPQWTGKEEPEQPLTISSPPLKLGVPIASLGAGEFAATAIVGALLVRNKTNLAEHIEVGIFETAVNLLAPSVYSLGKEKKKQSAINYKLKDGEWLQGSPEHIGSIARFDRWKVFCDIFQVSKDDYEATNTEEKRNVIGNQALKKIISKYVSQFTLEEVRKMIVDNNIIAGAVVTMKEVLRNDHLKQKLIPLIVSAEAGMTDNPKTVYHMMLPIGSEDYNPKTTEKWSPAPKLGQNTIETMRKLGYTEDQIKDLLEHQFIYSQP